MIPAGAYRFLLNSNFISILVPLSVIYIVKSNFEWSCCNLKGEISSIEEATSFFSFVSFT